MVMNDDDNLSSSQNFCPTLNCSPKSWDTHYSSPCSSVELPLATSLPHPYTSVNGYPIRLSDTGYLRWIVSLGRQTRKGL